MGLGGVAIAVLPSVVYPKQSFSDRLGGEEGTSPIGGAGRTLNNLEPHPERPLFLIPVSSEEHEFAYLACRPHVLSDTRTHIVVADAYQP